MTRLRQRPLGPRDPRNPRRQRRHGLSPAEHDALYRLQGGRCAICLRSGVPLQVDHDHRHHDGPEGCARCVRGLLCGTCNSGLGWISDRNIDRLIVYLGGTPPRTTA